MNARRAEGANVAASKFPLSNVELAKRFQARVIPFSAADLASAAHRTKSAAKGWKDGSRAPDSASLLNMARALPSVQAMVAEEIGMTDRAAQANSADSIRRAIYMLASGSGADALWAQKQIALMSRTEDERVTKPEPLDTQTISFMDRLQRRRG